METAREVGCCRSNNAAGLREALKTRCKLAGLTGVVTGHSSPSGACCSLTRPGDPPCEYLHQTYIVQPSQPSHHTCHQASHRSTTCHYAIKRKSMNASKAQCIIERRISRCSSSSARKSLERDQQTACRQTRPFCPLLVFVHDFSRNANNKIASQSDS